MNTSKKTARLAGVLFLMMVVFGLLSEILFRQRVFSSSDPAIVADNILSNMFLYRTGVVLDMFMTLFYMFTALALHKLLASVSRSAAATMVIFAASGSILLLCNTLIELAPFYILSNNGYMGAFSLAQQQSLAMLFYNLYQHGYMIGQIFFSLWVLPLGIMIYKSGFMPRILGIFFITETIFGLAAFIVHFLFPNATLETVLMLPMMVAEFSFMFYLLIRGLNESKVPKTSLNE